MGFSVGHAASVTVRVEDPLTREVSRAVSLYTSTRRWVQRPRAGQRRCIPVYMWVLGLTEGVIHCISVYVNGHCVALQASCAESCARQWTLRPDTCVSVGL